MYANYVNYNRYVDTRLPQDRNAYYNNRSNERTNSVTELKKTVEELKDIITNMQNRIDKLEEKIAEYEEPMIFLEGFRIFQEISKEIPKEIQPVLHSGDKTEESNHPDGMSL